MTTADPYEAYLHAALVARDRVPESEALIASDPDAALNYARYVIRGRFEAGETAILSDPHCAHEYAVILRDWLAAQTEETEDD